jgi:hypothetical protein
VAVLRRLAASGRLHVDVGVPGAVFRQPRADLEQGDVGIRAVLQAMAVRVAGLEPGRVAGAQDLVSRTRRQDDLARQNVDEFVLLGVPVPLA